MSENKYNFDTWLTENLKQSCPVNPAFSQKVVREMEHLKARKLLDKVILQERLAGGAFVLVVGIGLGIMFYPPILRAIYSVLEEGLRAIVYTIMEPSRFISAPAVLVLMILGLLIKAVWDNITSEA